MSLHHATHSSGHHHHHISQAQLWEYTRIAKPEKGIGFGYDSDHIQPGEFERWYAALTPTDRERLTAPQSTVTLIAQASRTGRPEYNLRLSERRGREVERHLKGLRDFAAKVVICPVGESQALGPDDIDNHNDRKVLVMIGSAPLPIKPVEPNVPKAIEAVFAKARRPQKSHAASDQIGILFDIFVKPLKKVKSNIEKGKVTSLKDLIPKYEPRKMAIEFAVRETVWMGGNLAADHADTKIMPRLTSSLPWGVINGLEQICEAELTQFSRQFDFSPVYYLTGVEMAGPIWAAMDPGEQENLKAVLKDAKSHRKFVTLEGEKLLAEWTSRGYNQTARDFKPQMDAAVKFLEQVKVL